MIQLDITANGDKIYTSTDGNRYFIVNIFDKEDSYDFKKIENLISDVLSELYANYKQKEKSSKPLFNDNLERYLSYTNVFQRQCFINELYQLFINIYHLQGLTMEAFQSLLEQLRSTYVNEDVSIDDLLSVELIHDYTQDYDIYYEVHNHIDLYKLEKIDDTSDIPLIKSYISHTNNNQYILNMMKQSEYDDKHLGSYPDPETMKLRDCD